MNDEVLQVRIETFFILAIPLYLVFLDSYDFLIADLGIRYMEVAMVSKSFDIQKLLRNFNDKK